MNLVIAIAMLPAIAATIANLDADASLLIGQVIEIRTRI